MSRADHPAGRLLHTAVCDIPGCTAPAEAAVVVLPGVAMIRPAAAPGAPGNRFCLDCTHHAVDQMLMRARPAPERKP